jgi:hypothetical protein
MHCDGGGGRGCLVCGTYAKYTYRALGPGPARAMLMFTHGCVSVRVMTELYFARKR